MSSVLIRIDPCFGKRQTRSKTEGATHEVFQNSSVRSVQRDQQNHIRCRTSQNIMRSTCNNKPTFHTVVNKCKSNTATIEPKSHCIPTVRSITENIQQMINKELYTPQLNAMKKSHQISKNTQIADSKVGSLAKRHNDTKSMSKSGYQSTSMMNRYMTVSTFEYFESEPSLQKARDLTHYHHRSLNENQSSENRQPRNLDDLYVRQFMDMLKITKSQPRNKKTLQSNFKRRLQKMKNLGNYGSVFKQKPILLNERVQQVAKRGESNIGSVSEEGISKGDENPESNQLQKEGEQQPFTHEEQKNTSRDQKKCQKDPPEITRKASRRCHTASYFYQSSTEQNNSPQKKTQKGNRYNTDRCKFSSLKAQENYELSRPSTKVHKTGMKFQSMSTRNKITDSDWKFEPWQTEKSLQRKL